MATRMAMGYPRRSRGVTRVHAVSSDDEQTWIDLKEAIPEEGMVITIVNRGDGVYQFIRHDPVGGLELTAEDVEKLRRGEITFQ